MPERSVILGFLFLFVSVNLWAQKTDTVVLLNQNVIKGEIKNLDMGLLTFKTDGMGTVNIKAEEIKSLKSDKRFQIQLSNGYIYFGTLDTVDAPGTYVKIITSSKTVYKTDFKNIVSIFPFRRNFWSRLSGTFSFGLSYNKSSDIFNSTFSGNIKYWGKRRQIDLSWTDNIAVQNDTVVTNKQSNSLSYKHYIRKHYSGQGTFEYAKNKELELKHRYSVDLLAGMDIVHRYRSLLYLGTGVSGNSELYTGDTASNVNMEWVFKFNFSIYKRSSPEMSLTASSNMYPSLTVNGRFRVNSTIEGRVEVFKNFYVGLQFYDDFDNKPHGNETVAGSKTNDWGVNGTVSYSFH
jgi:hypothetical protein